MGVSYSIVPKCEVQENNGWREYILSQKIIGKPEFSIREEGNDFPTLTEIYESIKEANINPLAQGCTSLVRGCPSDSFGAPRTHLPKDYVLYKSKK